MAGPTPDDPIPEERVPGILARAAELDRNRRETSSVDALREAALEAGISQSALDAALEEYAASTRRARPTEAAPAPTSGTGRKSERVGTLLAVFLGGFGGHRFYLGDKRGLLYLPFFWTFVPTVVGLVEAFYMGKRVRTYNERAGAAALEPPGESPALEPSRQPGRDATADAERRPCPHCAELILPGARICRYCRSEL